MINKQNKKTLYLVNAPNDFGMSNISNDASFPALGVLSLGTWVKNQIPDLEVIVRDGGVYSNEEIIDDILTYKPEIVGVSVLSTSYQNSLSIAKTAKNVGAKTIFGNDHASQLSKKILYHNNSVDFVIGSEYGEKSLELLIKRELYSENISLSSIPQLTFRDGNDILGFNYSSDKSTLSIMDSSLNLYGRKDNVLDVFPIVDRTLYPKEHWETYLKNYLEKFSKMHESEITGVTTMNRARGCSRANDKCRFCDMYLDPVSSSANMFWKEVKSAHEQVGANVFYEVCDSFSSFPKLLKEIAESYPKNLGFNPQFFVYAQSRELVKNKDIIKYFKDIGVFRVNIGIESFSDKTLHHMKGIYDNVNNHFSALNMLKNAGIYVYSSLVLGSDAETESTLDETFQGAKKAIDEGLIYDIEVQPLLPLPNNEYGKKLLAAGLFPGGTDSDWPISTNDISSAYINNFSGVSYERVMFYRKKIMDYALNKGIQAGSGIVKDF